MKMNQKKLPSRVLYVITGVIVVVFVLFWLVGFNRPYEDNGNFNAPLFTDVLMILTLLLTIGTFGVAAWSLVRSFRTTGGGERVVNNIPVRKIGMIVTGGTATLLVLTFLCGSTAPMRINGFPFTDTFWLRVSDMFVATSLLMIVAAVTVAIYGATKYIRRHEV